MVCTALRAPQKTVCWGSTSQTLWTMFILGDVKMQILIHLCWEYVVFVKFYSGREFHKNYGLCSKTKNNNNNNSRVFHSRPVFFNFDCTSERLGKLLPNTIPNQLPFLPSSPSINQKVGRLLLNESKVKPHTLRSQSWCHRQTVPVYDDTSTENKCLETFISI